MPSASDRSPAAAVVPSRTATGIPVQVKRSARRTRTVNAVLRDGMAVVSIPASFSAAQEAEWVTRMIQRLDQKSPAAPTDPDNAAGELAARAEELSRRYLGGRARPQSVRWVRNQNSRWGSATPARGSIRLSHKLQGMPQWVIDYVLLHELAHFIEPSHGPAFWRLLEDYPSAQTAKAFLEGAAFASAHGLQGAISEDDSAGAG